LSFKNSSESAQALLSSTYNGIPELSRRLRAQMADWLRKHDQTLPTRFARPRAAAAESTPAGVPERFASPGLVVTPANLTVEIATAPGARRSDSSRESAGGGSE